MGPFVGVSTPLGWVLGLLVASPDLGVEWVVMGDVVVRPT